MDKIQFKIGLDFLQITKQNNFNQINYDFSI